MTNILLALILCVLLARIWQAHRTEKNIIVYLDSLGDMLGDMLREIIENKKK